MYDQSKNKEMIVEGSKPSQEPEPESIKNSDTGKTPKKVQFQPKPAKPNKYMAGLKTKYDQPLSLIKG